jgi:undecaprenyl-phosphate 4-deoxy-4-formamido-L-arabinose transferase
LGSRFNDRVASFLLRKPHGLYLSSFKCLRRFTVKEIIKYQGPYPYIDGLILRCTRNIGEIEVRHDPRRDGHSNYSLRRLIALWLNMAVNLPLRVSTVLGLGCSAAGFALGILVIVERLFFSGLPMPLGWASVIVAVLLLSGTQLAMLGLVGEYLGRLFLMVNRTPQFVIRDIYCKGQRCASDLTPTPITSVANRC